MTAASSTSMGLRLPLTSPASCSTPNPPTSTLQTERFMALAMSTVSRVPAAPTRVPATMRAAFPMAKPSKPTAMPVKAL